jgi:hypothetical protein
MNSLSEPTHEGDSSRGGETGVLTCPACGAAARRASAHFCSTCGRGLREHAYAPADSLFASYHQQHTRPAMLFEQEMSGVGERRATAVEQFEEPRVLAAGSALVVIIFAFVPLIGVLFCPCAVVMGVIQLRRAPDSHGRRVAIFNIVFGIFVLGAHAFLWWLLILMAI